MPTIVQPVVVQMVAEPLAPLSLHGHAAPNRYDGEGETGRRKRHEPQGLRPELRCIPSLNCVEKIAIPEIQSILSQQLQEHGAGQQYNQEPGAPRRSAMPKSRRTLPEA